MEIVRFGLSDSGANAGEGVNVTNEDVAAKIEAGNVAMTSPYGVQSVGGVCVDYSGNIYVADSGNNHPTKLAFDAVGYQFIRFYSKSFTDMTKIEIYARYF